MFSPLCFGKMFESPQPGKHVVLLMHANDIVVGNYAHFVFLPSLK